MWYMPPFVALLFVLTGGGITAIATGGSPAAALLAAAILAPYAMHMPFTLPLDRTVQREIEDGVRSRVGKILDGLIGAERHSDPGARRLHRVVFAQQDDL